ncbi:MAG: DUF3093 family protein [Chloroflexi bacterium]|nr:DUF3093 family protein [Chloroflexota bacterium]
MTDSPATYEERLEAPGWLRWVLLAALLLIISTIGLQIGAGTAAAGPTSAFISVVAAVLSGAAFLFAYLNFLTLRVRVSNGEFMFAYGVVRHRVQIDQIESVETNRYRWARYGGWGYSRGPLGRRAWSMPGVPEGVVVLLHESGKRREYFVSSHAPERLEAAIRAGMTGGEFSGGPEQVG